MYRPFYWGIPIFSALIGGIEDDRMMQIQVTGPNGVDNNGTAPTPTPGTTPGGVRKAFLQSTYSDHMFTLLISNTQTPCTSDVGV